MYANFQKLQLIGIVLVVSMATAVMDQPVGVVWRRAEDGPTSESSQIVPDAVIEDDPLFNPDFPVTIPRLCWKIVTAELKKFVSNQCSYR